MARKLLADPAADELSRFIWLPRMLERLFRQLKGFRRISSRWEKLDAMFVAFINFV